MPSIECDYVLTAPAHEVEAFARRIALEQSVEVPEAVVRAAALPDRLLGQVRSITPLPAAAHEPDAANAPDAARFTATIAYDLELAAGQLPQLLNLLFGNISIQNHIRLTALRLPPELLARFPGPRFGLPGLRNLLGVHDRPLLATALKPRGVPLTDLERLARDFALGGGDVLKDDHNLVEPTFDEFRTRVDRIQTALDVANAATGRRTLYFPTLLAPAEDLDRAAAHLAARNIAGVLVCPFITGLDAVRSLAARYPLAIMTHPAFCGTFLHDPRHGIAPDVLLGTLMRLIAADASVFPNTGGRFSFTPQQCVDLRRALHAPLGSLAPAWPAPAGGMQFDNLPAMAEMYGPDAIFLIGGALLGHSADLQASTAAFLSRICEFFTPRYQEPSVPLPSQQCSPAPEFASSCEWTPPVAAGPEGAIAAQAAAATSSTEATAAASSSEAASAAPSPRLLQFLENFGWTHRSAIVYKAAAELPFRDVARWELLRGADLPAAFDLRYFELAPGGFTSLEKHQHVHAILCLRGRGTLVLDPTSLASGATQPTADAAQPTQNSELINQNFPLAPFDVACVPPLAVHQLRNAGPEPFGFLCIVDRDRDRPQAP